MSLVLNLGVVIGVVAVALAVNAYAGVDAKRRSLSPRLQIVIGLISLGGVWLVYFLDWMPSVIVDDSVVALTLSIALWVGLPLLVTPFVETHPPSSTSC